MFENFVKLLSSNGMIISNTNGNIDVTGNVVLNNDISVSGNLNVAQNIVHTGDTDTKLSFYNDVITLTTANIERFRV